MPLSRNVAQLLVIAAVATAGHGQHWVPVAATVIAATVVSAVWVIIRVAVAAVIWVPVAAVVTTVRIAGGRNDVSIAAVRITESSS